VYFIGDTPESDIQGMNTIRCRIIGTAFWCGQPKTTVDNVLKEVKHWMQKEFSMGMKEMTIEGRAPQLSDAIEE